DVAVIDRQLAAPINAFRAEFDLPKVGRLSDSWWYSPQLILGLFPPWFAPPQPDWPSQVLLTGFPLFDEPGLEPPPSAVMDFLATGEPPIVFYPGSPVMHGRALAMSQGRTFFQEALEACKILKRRGLFVTDCPKQLPRDLPREVRHFNDIPFSQVLPR